MSEADPARYIGIGQEPIYGNPAVLDETATDGAPFTADRDVAEPSILEVIARGITTGGTFSVPGNINGAVHFEDFVLAIDAGTQVVTGLEVFQGLDLSTDAITVSGGLAGGTIELRVATQEFVDVVDESLKAKQGTEMSERVRAQFSQFSTPGAFDVAGDINLVAEPEGGFERLMKWAFCLVSTTPLGGASVLAATAIAATLTFDNDIVPNVNGGDKRILITVTGTAVAGTVTIPGTVNSSGDSEVVTLNSANGFAAATLKAFDSLDLTADAIDTTGLTAGTITIVQVDAYDHLITPGGVSPSFFARIGVDGVWEKEVQGLVVDALQMVFGASKYVTAKISATGRTEQASPSIAVPSFSDIEPFDTNASTVTRDLGLGAAAYDIIMEATLNMGRNPSKDRRVLANPGRFRASQPWQRGEVDLTLKLLFEATAEDKTADEEYRSFWGNITADGPQGSTVPWDLNLLFDSEVEIYSGGETYQIALEVPTGIVDEFSNPIVKRDVLEQEVAIKALNDPAIGFALRLRIRNGLMEF